MTGEQNIVKVLKQKLMAILFFIFKLYFDNYFLICISFLNVNCLLLFF